MAQAGVPAHIWNVSSIGGLSAAPRQAPYIVSKHAVLALTECLKLEVDAAGYDIRVGVVVPGPVVSQIFERAGGAQAGDSQAGAAERETMLNVKEIAMPAIEAAEQIFAQAARTATSTSTRTRGSARRSWVRGRNNCGLRAHPNCPNSSNSEDRPGGPPVGSLTERGVTMHGCHAIEGS